MTSHLIRTTETTAALDNTTQLEFSSSMKNIKTNEEKKSIKKNYMALSATPK
jgi:hypothetical protein